MQILFFAKRDCWAVDFALRALDTMNVETTVYRGKRSDPFPEDVEWLDSDITVSFLSPWIIPGKVLQRAQLAALNFHPGPPEYPGIGCTNFALYNNDEAFGVTCHHMAAKVDTGPIVDVARFPLFPTDTVQSLTERCYVHLCAMFVRVMADAVHHREVPTVTDHSWMRRPYTRAELEALSTITPDMKPEEIQRRIRATAFPGYPPQMTVGDKTFALTGRP